MANLNAKGKSKTRTFAMCFSDVLYSVTSGRRFCCITNITNVQINLKNKKQLFMWRKRIRTKEGFQWSQLQTVLTVIKRRMKLRYIKITT